MTDHHYRLQPTADLIKQSLKSARMSKLNPSVTFDEQDRRAEIVIGHLEMIIKIMKAWGLEV